MQYTKFIMEYHARHITSYITNEVKIRVSTRVSIFFPCTKKSSPQSQRNKPTILWRGLLQTSVEDVFVHGGIYSNWRFINEKAFDRAVDLAIKKMRGSRLKLSALVGCDCDDLNPFVSLTQLVLFLSVLLPCQTRHNGRWSRDSGIYVCIYVLPLSRK